MKNNLLAREAKMKREAYNNDFKKVGKTNE